MHSIGTELDWVVLVVYMIAMLLFGTYFAKYNKDTNDFFFGGKRFAWWIIAMSIVATGISSHSFIKYSAMGFKYGFSSSMSYINDWFFVPFFLFGWLPIIIYSRVRSIPEYFERRFSPSARFLVTILQLLYLVGYVGIGFLTLGKAIMPLMPEYLTFFGIQFHITLMGLIWITAVITGAYITFGGQTAVIFTDLVQGLMLMTAGFIVFFLGIAYVGGWDSFWNLLPTTWKLPLAHFNSPSEFNSVGTFWEDGIAGSVGFLFMNMGLIMRFMATKSVHEGRKAATVNILFMLPLSAIVVGGGGWVAKAISVKFPTIIPAGTAADEVFVVIANILTGPGVFGFVIAAIAAALMSTVSTLVNAAAAIWVNDVDRPLRIWLKKVKKEEKVDEKRAMVVARSATVGFTLLGVLAVYAFSSYPTVYQAHAFFHATLTPPLMVAIFFGVFWKRFTPAGLITTVIGGIGLMLLGNRYPLELIGPLAQGTPYDPVHPFTYMAALYNLIVTSSVAILATVFQRQLKTFVKIIRKNAHHKSIMFGVIAFIVIVVVFDIFTALFSLSIVPLVPLLLITILMSGLVALATTYYVKYDAKAQTLGLTIWSIHQAKEWFKGSKLNEREGENAIVNWKLAENDNEDIINFSKHDMHKMAAEVGDLVYISDKRKFLGGLKSCHTVFGEPHSEKGVVYIRKLHIEKGLFVDGRLLEAEKEM
ncbi:MAG: sodium:solute symporter family protein [Bacteroidetes bacterium]|nr:sodium:solute symporter family protein [Bacteroidota bacterium]MBU1116363.1 sodium:solute symporter family protein [Bacteroidota bacterium]MBU1800387.1 sodium:solute symporter family protein [Bacteroidota bacterium]